MFPLMRLSIIGNIYFIATRYSRIERIAITATTRTPPEAFGGRPVKSFCQAIQYS